MPATDVVRSREAAALARKHPAALRYVNGHFMDQRAHLEAITTFWGGCPTKVLSPALIPKKIRSPTAPRGDKYGPIEPTDWDKDLVKGLRLLAPLCTAKDASFWLMTEVKKERREANTDNDCMTRHAVHAVYKAFLPKGYQAKTLVQAQKENKEKKALLIRSVVSGQQAYDPTKLASRSISFYRPEKRNTERLAAAMKVNPGFKFPWEDDYPAGASQAD